MSRLAAIAILLAMAAFPSIAGAAPSPYQARAEQLVRLLSAPGDEGDFFSSLFLEAVPLDRWRSLAAELRDRHGRPQALGAVTRTSGTAGQVEVRYERATLGFSMVVAPDAPNRVVGLHLVGVTMAGDNIDRIAADLAALPGSTAFAVARLSDGAPQMLHASHAEVQMATGSSFKLLILAEAARAVAAGERRWSDVIPLRPKSFSGRLMDWPNGAPMTLHSLATAMIAESDNSAADTLLLALGRDKVDAMARVVGFAEPDRMTPVLGTAEAFALKMPGNRDLRARYAAATSEERRALLQDNAAALSADKVDVGSVAETPVAIDSIEWFASARDMVQMLDRLRLHGDDALPILAVNPGIALADAKRWVYLGYKGGSEPGVMAMNFLARRRDGAWYAVSASWNNPAARVEEARFTALMTRILNLLAE